MSGIDLDKRANLVYTLSKTSQLVRVRILSGIFLCKEGRKSELKLLFSRG